MQENAKAMATALKRALASKGLDLRLGQALDVAATLTGTKDWNALNAVLRQRHATLALRQALQGMLEMANSLASEAGDAPEWNDGGVAREACKKARAALAGLPASEALDGSVDYVMAADAVDHRLWVEVNNISVYIRRNDKGVSVDLYPLGAEDGESLAGTWALFQDAEADDSDDSGDSDDSDEAFPQTWVIYSRSEEDISGDAGYWSNDFGWSLREHATLFSSREKAMFDLPHSAGDDAGWIGLLKPFRVSLTESGESDPVLFECQAEAADHAREQAENAYPGCTVHAVEVALPSVPQNDAVIAHRNAVYRQIASASAWRIDGSPRTTNLSKAVIEGSAENEVFHFTWIDEHGRSCSETLTEADLVLARTTGNAVYIPTGDGAFLTILCLSDVAGDSGKPAGTPHICGLAGEYAGPCPACEETRIAARDLVAEWVGLHCGVNFDSEPSARQDDWVARFMEAHAADNPLFPLRDWQYEIDNGDTRLGYAEWLAHRLESQHFDREAGMLDAENDKN